MLFTLENNINNLLNLQVVLIIKKVFKIEKRK